MAERAALRASPCAKRRETHKQGRHRRLPASSQEKLRFSLLFLSCVQLPVRGTHLSTREPGGKAVPALQGSWSGSFTDSLRKSGVIAIVFLLYGMCSPPACAPGVRPSPKPEACAPSPGMEQHTRDACRGTRTFQ